MVFHSGLDKEWYHAIVVATSWNLRELFLLIQCIVVVKIYLTGPTRERQLRLLSKFHSVFQSGITVGIEIGVGLLLTTCQIIVYRK